MTNHPAFRLMRNRVYRRVHRNDPPIDWATVKVDYGEVVLLPSYGVFSREALVMVDSQPR